MPHEALKRLAIALPGHTFSEEVYVDTHVGRLIYAITVNRTGYQHKYINVADPSMEEALREAMARLEGASLTRDEHAAIDELKKELVFLLIAQQPPAPSPKTGETGGLWRKHGRGGKYVVLRRDGTTPEWPGFVMGARDPAAPAALRAYADEAEKLGLDPRYVADMRELAADFEAYRATHGAGDPDGVPHRKDNPAILALGGGGTM